ncbi:MAG: YbhB/YbcL family Raf kinase inhibitor-like protein [Anaerolineae bacterium]|nr:YbhB/YbcL family Raf kinase inhibitor-like protein [Anaerolineae bacterium]
MPFALSSAAFAAQADIPTRYTCHGENLSPALQWTSPPADTQSLVLLMDDPDAVPVAGRVWDHWVLFNIPASATSLPESLPKEEQLPDGSQHGRTSSSQLGYSGPCPPSGQTHGYVFTLYALDTILDLEPRPTKAAVLTAMEGHILAQAELVGLYTSP